MKGLQIRLASFKDIEDILELENENQKYYAIEIQGPSDIREQKLRKKIEEASSLDGVYVVENEIGAMIACCIFDMSITKNGYTHIRYYVSKQYKEPFGIKALNIIVQKCFGDLNYNKLNIRIRSSKRQMLEILLASGFMIEARLREHFYINGKYKDVLAMGITKEDFNNKKIHKDEIVNISNTEFDDDYKLKVNLSPIKQLLIGEKIDLTPVNEDDIKVMYELSKNSNEKQYGYIGAPAPAELQEYKRIVERKNDYFTLKKGISFGIRTKDGRIAGTIGAGIIDLKNRHLMVGLGILSDKDRGKGYGSEAIRLFNDYAFLELNMHRVYLGCFNFNEKARMLYERIGFKLEGIDRAFVFRNGNYYDGSVLGLLRREWLELRGYIDKGTDCD
ncbi:GNAT family protein [Clostridiaceae bacterium M8S5]|nr:GNAT family protein [Clostridiaceae bacterium M8S5]